MTQPVQLIEPTEPVNARHLSRKWLLTLLVVALSAGLLWAGKIDAARWVELNTWVLGLYMLGNGVNAWAAVWGRR